MTIEPLATPATSPRDASAVFANAAHDAIALLRALPRAPGDTAEARKHLRAFAAAHPDASPEFLIDLAPGAEHADFDIYLEHPQGGTVAVTYREDAGRPWFVDYSEHWAANYVLHVGSKHVRVQEALFAIQYGAARNPDLVASLVRDTLLAEAMESDPNLSESEDVSVQELQESADAFRYAHHLQSAADTHAWLEQMGWSMHRFQSVLATGVRLRRAEEKLVVGRIEPHFEACRADFDLVHVFRAECDDAVTAAALAQAAAGVGLMAATQRFVSEHAPGAPIGRVDGALATSRAYTFNAAIRAAAAGAVVGPLHERERHVVSQILAREPATTLDAPTRRAVRERLVQEWLAERTREVPIRWNWV